MLGARLHDSLLCTLSSGGNGGSGRGSSDGSGTLLLLELLSTTKAALRCLAVAEGCGLQLGSGRDAEQQRQRFVGSLLCTPYSSASQSHTGLRLLWELVVHQPGSCAMAAPRACDILLWCLAPPLPELQHLLLGHAAEACPAEELAGQLLVAKAGSADGARSCIDPSPFWRVSRE